ncbi:LLM class flavin-dependent oxidoreductase [Novosphingobium sp. PY1]|uniref:LLM class flavin-dependent oxidoreductase n=1 Tax=Novosphingobium sp. PY1 TaxID=1882221 RepID=UPI001A8CA9DC|nr:LLM class flavin-dependent oxidoreductase [Novosphingobium sp. PY1]GFM30953.1 putative monooxygenase [Novosphingobium sp. PY1]
MTQKTRAGQYHLFAMPMGSGGHMAGWRHEEAEPAALMTLGYWQHIARTAERGMFDALFLADSQGFRPIAGVDAFAATDAIRLDPLVLHGALAASTQNLGLVATVSTSYNEPYAIARRLSTLDHVSAGRAAWNVVTSTSENEAHNFGREAHYGHAERYARAEEAIAVCKGLWDGWEDGAVIADKASGVFFEAAKVNGLYHKGEHFCVAGPLTMGRSPQGHPLIVQAGASEEGLELAARTADAVFTSHPTMESGVAFYAGLKKRVAAAGRDPESLRIMTAIQPVPAVTAEQAEAEAKALNEAIPPKLALSYLKTVLGGIDLSRYDLDGPLPELPDSNASLGTRQRIIDMGASGMTLGEIAVAVAASRTSRSLAGTAETIADELERWYEARACDGFVIAPPSLPVMLDRFVDLVVPELQRRGRVRTAYKGSTLRENLGLGRPQSRYTLDPALRAEPEIWQG